MGAVTASHRCFHCIYHVWCFIRPKQAFNSVPIKQCFGVRGDQILRRDWISHNRVSITVWSHNALPQQPVSSSTLERQTTSRLLSFSISLSSVSLSIFASHLSVLCHSVFFYSAPSLPDLLLFIILLWLLSSSPYFCLGLPLSGGHDSLILEQWGNTSSHYLYEGKLFSCAFFSFF